MRVRVDEGRGPAVVLLHGQPGSASDWVRVVPLLRERGLRVVAVDRPGYGADAAAPATSWAANAGQLLGVLDDLALGAAVLVGWSWGGGVALRAALDAPERVAALVLAASVGHSAAVGATDRLLAAPGVRRLLPRLMARVGPRAVALLQLTNGRRLDGDALRIFAAEARLWSASGAWEAFAEEQVTMVRDAEQLSAALVGVRAPTTVVHGWHDQYVAVRAAAALTAALPTARLVPLDAGHLLPFERPAELADLIAAAARPDAPLGDEG